MFCIKRTFKAIKTVSRPDLPKNSANSSYLCMCVINNQYTGCFKYIWVQTPRGDYLVQTMKKSWGFILNKNFFLKTIYSIKEIWFNSFFYVLVDLIKCWLPVCLINIISRFFGGTIPVYIWPNVTGFYQKWNREYGKTIWLEILTYLKFWFEISASALRLEVSSV